MSILIDDGSRVLEMCIRDRPCAHPVRQVAGDDQRDGRREEQRPRDGGEPRSKEIALQCRSDEYHPGERCNDGGGDGEGRALEQQ